MASSKAEISSDLTRIDLQDQGALQRELETNASQAAESLGLQPSYLVDNIRILLGFLMVAVAAGAHLLPGKFPSHYWQLASCVAAYYVMNGFSILFTVFVIRDAFLRTKASPEQGTPAMRMQLHFPRHSETFKFILQADEWKHETQPEKVVEFFHEDGYIAADKFKAWLTSELMKAGLGKTAKKLQ